MGKQFLLRLLAIVLTGYCLVIPAVPQSRMARREWEPDRRLTVDPGASQLSFNFARSIAVDDTGTVHIVWYDDREGHSQVYYKRSVVGGADWGPDTRVSSRAGSAQHPAVAASGSCVYAVWHDIRSGRIDIYFKRSVDGGLNWEPEIRLSAGNRGGSAHSSIAVSGTNVYVVWGDHRDGEQAEIYFRGSSDGGETWSAELRVSEVPFDSWVPTVAASGRRVYVAWVDTRDGNEEEYLRVSADGGATWGPITRLTNEPANSWAPSIAVSGDTAHLVWFDQRDSRVQPLQAEEKLNEAMDLLELEYEPAPSGVMVVNPEAAAKKRATEKLQQIHNEAPGWVERGGDIRKLMAIFAEFEAITRRGASYMEKERKLDEAMKLLGLKHRPGPSEDLPKVYYGVALHMRIQDKLLQVQGTAPGWVQDGGDPTLLQQILEEFQYAMEAATVEWEIYYIRSTDGGVTWTPAERLTNAPGLSLRPSLALWGNRLSLVWFDGRNGNAEVYYKESSDGGISWSADVRLTDAPGDSLHPSIAITSDSLHVVWFDQRDGNAEIYYKRGHY